MADCEKYIEMICGLADGELTAEQEAELRAHLDACQDCKRLYDAVTNISGALSEDLVEPPEALAQGIMFKIRSKGGAGKAHRFAFGRFTALAACIALVLLAGSRFGWFGGMGRSNAPKEASMQDVDTAENYSESSLSKGSAADKSADGEELDGYSEGSPESGSSDNGAQFTVPNNGLTAAGGGSSVTTKLDSLIFAGNVEVYEGASTKEGRILVLSDSKSKEELFDILAFAGSDAADLTRGSEPDYTLLFSDGSTLRIWYADGSICCDFGDSSLYVAAGTTEAFETFLAQALSSN